MPTVTIWSWYDREKLYINPDGIIDHNAIRAFTSGQCHALAIAIHRLSGKKWGLFGLCDYQNEPSDPGHVVVKVPKTGAYLDINGPGVLARWRKKYGPITIHPLTEEQAKSQLLTYLKPCIKQAIPFAKTLMEKYG